MGVWVMCSWLVGSSLGVKECWPRENSVNCRTFNYKTRPLGGEGGTVEQFQSKYIHTIVSQCRRPQTLGRRRRQGVPEWMMMAEQYTEELFLHPL